VPEIKCTIIFVGACCLMSKISFHGVKYGRRPNLPAQRLRNTVRRRSISASASWHLGPRWPFRNSRRGIRTWTTVDRQCLCTILSYNRNSTTTRLLGSTKSRFRLLTSS